MRLEYTTCSFDAQTEEKGGGSTGKLVGLGSHFHNVDAGRDVILPGAFEESIAAKMPAMLWQHDHAMIPGKWDSAREVPKGLELTGTLALKTQLGNDVHELAKIKAVTGLSIGFQIPPGGSEFTNDGVRVIKKIDLWEVSIVTFPMNDLARLSSVKSKLARGDEITERELEFILRDAGLSRTKAKAIVAGGYKHQGDSELRDEVNRTLSIIENIRRGIN